MEEKFPQDSKHLKTNDLAWNNFEHSLETLLRDRRQPDQTAGHSTEPPPPPSPCSTLSDQLPFSSPANRLGGDQVHPRPIPTINIMSTMNMTMQQSYTITSPSSRSLVSSLKCEMCPSPSPFTATDHDSWEIHMASHHPVKFLCAACGQRIEDYEEMVKHVETEHVGDDQELVRASIVIPDNIHLLKTFQCGIKSCGRKLVGLTELDLKEHIRRNHGEFYIHMGQGRNLLRLCRLCPSIKFVSDQSLSEHLQQSHPVALYANGESREILPALTPLRASVTRDSVSDRGQVQTSGEVEGGRERLDGWYFRDQYQRPDGNNGALLRDESRNARENPEDVHNNPSRYEASIERESRRERYDRHKLAKVHGQDKIGENIRKKRLHGENERFSISPSEPRGKNDEIRPIDLKYKLKNIREAKKDNLTKVYCHACSNTTQDWVNHKFSLKHIQNEKKARCLYCPKRLWFSKLKSHVQSVHKGCSFSCNITSSCLVRLMDLGKLTDHINEKHRDEVDKLWQQFGQNWQSRFVSSHHLAKNNFFLLPSDLRKLSCKMCGLKFLGQGQSALNQHFQLEHPDLTSSRYKATILYECRACDGMLFGSEFYLLEHFRQDHADAGLSINRESEEEGRPRNRIRMEPIRRRDEYYSDSSRNVFRHENSSLRKEKRLKSNEASYSHMRRRNSEVRTSRSRASSSTRSGENASLFHKEKEQEVERTRHSGGIISKRKRRYSESSSINFKIEETKMKVESIETEEKPFYSYRKRINSEVVKPCRSNDRSSFEEYDSQTTDEDAVVTCPFCDKRTLQSRLFSHMKKKHKENLFSCDGTCDKKFKSAWKSEVISHLKIVHKLDLSDSILSRHYLRLPINRAMICCKVADCYEATFLSRNVKHVEKSMIRHVEKYHEGQLARDCFNLCCRSCCSVFTVEEEAEWEKHLAKDHRSMTSIRPSTVNSSKVDVNESGPGSEQDCSYEVCHGSEERSVRLVSGPSSPVHEKDQLAMAVCKFCGEMVEDEKRVEHELRLHLTRLFSCQICQGIDKRWVGQTALELVSHVAQDHKTDIKFEDIPAPKDKDTTLSICTVCQAQFYSRDPSMLAIHLLDHDLGPDMELFLYCCRICYSVKSNKDPVKNLAQHNEEVHFKKNIFNQVKVKEEQEDTSTSNLKKCQQVITKNTSEENCQFCPYCGDVQDEIPSHVSTHHWKSTFRCTLCVYNKVWSATSSVTMFDKLDEAMEHMSTVHQLSMLPAKIAQARATSSPTTVCPVISYLGLHCPGLQLPARTCSLSQLYCPQCKATLLKVDTSSSKQLVKHANSCDSQQMLLQCKLCLVSLPDAGCGSAEHFK